MPDLIGGRYRVGKAIGQGGMGTVWLCRDERLSRDVAVKQVGLLPGESVTDSARALREARSSAGLSHPHVVTVFDVVEDADRIWLVMEHVPGRSLSQIIKQDGPLDPAVVADIGAQVADGLAALHAEGTMHRDVKPGNVLVRDDGVAKISDFGIARTAGDQTLTSAGYLTGTPSYFSPALAQGRAPTPQDDVWALGATLYAAAEGHPPYERRSNPVEVLHDIVTTSPRSPQRADFLTPALARMLDRDPESRWSMDDASHMLRRLAETHRSESTLMQTRESTLGTFAEPSPAERPSAERPVRPAPTPAPTRPAPARPARRGTGLRRPLLAVLALLVVVGLVWAVAQLAQSRQQTGTAGSPPSKQPTNAAPQGPSQKKPQASDNGGAGSSSSAGDEMEQFVRDYFAKAPGGTDEAWAMLGPSLQQQGRSSYDAFWRGIESVEVRSATASPSDDTVDVTLVYRSTNGATSTERKREGLVNGDDGGYLLDTDTPAS